MSEKLWQGRFSEKTASVVEAFTSSIQVDKRLYAYDIQGSIAHCKTLAKASIITETEASEIILGLESIQQEIEAGRFQFDDSLEDIHMHIESRLVEIAGPVGRKLHTARSRNDQVALDVRMYLRVATGDIIGRLHRLQQVLVALAKQHTDTILPGYTHMQHAMPSTVALWCGGFDEGFSDACDGLRSVRRRINKNPLGSAAGYGTPGLPLDRDATTATLEFDATQNPVTAVQLSRGKAESALLFEITLLMQDLGRMASDLLMFYTQEFAYVSLAAEVTTGSSIMPQKRNPDVLELLRASSATSQACLNESLMITAKLPSGYHRDLQRLKSPLFRSIDLAIDSVDIMAYVLEGLNFLPDNIRLDDGIFATAEAYRLVREDGVPFREAYRQIAKRYAK